MIFRMGYVKNRKNGQSRSGQFLPTWYCLPENDVCSSQYPMIGSPSFHEGVPRPIHQQECTGLAVKINTCLKIKTGIRLSWENRRWRQFTKGSCRFPLVSIGYFRKLASALALRKRCCRVPISYRGVPDAKFPLRARRRFPSSIRPEHVLPPN